MRNYNFKIPAFTKVTYYYFYFKISKLKMSIASIAKAKVKLRERSRSVNHGLTFDELQKLTEDE